MSTYFSPKTRHSHPTERECDLYGVFETQGRVRVNVAERLHHGLPALSSSPLPDLPFAFRRLPSAVDPFPAKLLV